MNAMLRRFAIWFVIFLVLGIVGYSLSHQWLQFILPMMIFLIYVAVTLAMLQYNRNLVQNSKRVNQIDRFLRRRKKRPVTGYFYAAVHRDYTTARQMAELIRNPQQKLRALLDIALSLKQWSEVDELLAKIDDEEFRTWTLAYMALLQRDWERFEALKSLVKNDLHRLILEAEEAFVHGDVDIANQLGREALEMSKGLEYYVLAKGLEISQSNPNRESYF